MIVDRSKFAEMSSREARLRSVGCFFMLGVLVPLAAAWDVAVILGRGVWRDGLQTALGDVRTYVRKVWADEQKCFALSCALWSL